MLTFLRGHFPLRKTSPATICSGYPSRSILSLYREVTHIIVALFHFLRNERDSWPSHCSHSSVHLSPSSSKSAADSDRYVIIAPLFPSSCSPDGLPKAEPRRRRSLREARSRRRHPASPLNYSACPPKQTSNKANFLLWMHLVMLK